MKPTKPNVYTFATAFERRRFGSRRKGLVMFCLAHMSDEIVAQYGRGELSDVDVWKMADQMNLYQLPLVH